MIFIYRLFLHLIWLTTMVGCNEQLVLKVKQVGSSSSEIIVSNVSVNEGQSLTFTVELTSPSITLTKVDYQTANGSALSGSHYSAASGTLTFNPGETSKVVTIPTTANALEVCAPQKTLSLNLTNAQGSVIGVPSATGTITDPDSPSVSVSSASAVEGGDVGFLVSLSAVCPTKNVSFSLTRSDGGVITGSITSGQTSTTVLAPTVNNLVYDGTKNFSVTLGSLINASAGTTTATGTVTDDETIPSVVFGSASQTVLEGAATATVAISLSHASTQAITVPITLSGTATGSGTDYTASTLPLSIAPGTTTASVTLTLNNDVLSELSETIILTLGTPTNATKGATDVHTVTITDNDLARISNVTSAVANGTLTTGSVDIQVQFSSSVTVSGTPQLSLNTNPLRTASYFSGSGSTNIVFRYTIQGGDASADLDYLNTTALSLAGGTIVDTVTSANADLTLALPGSSGSLSNNKNIVIAGPTASTISSVTAPPSDIYYKGNYLYFTVEFSHDVTITGTPLLNLTIGGTNVSASYFDGSGSSYITFRYQVQSNLQATGITASSPLSLNGGTIKDVYNMDASLTFTPPTMNTILVDGRELILNFSKSNIALSEGITTTQLFTVTLNPAPMVDTTIPIVLEANNTTSGVDFNMSATNVVILAGQTSATFPFNIITDSINETSNYFTALIDRPSEKNNIVVGASYGSRVSILDDDPVKERWAVVSVGQYHSCGITQDAVLKCWGSNIYGAIGDGTTTFRPTPVVIDSGETYAHVTVGPMHTCAITFMGELKCWGENGDNQLGTGTGIDSYTPASIDSFTFYQDVKAGATHTCAITYSSQMKCWGSNLSGQLGTGNYTSYAGPATIDAATTYDQLSVHGHSNCAITTSGVLKCWGSNPFGGLGTGNTTTLLSPTAIDSSTVYQKVSVNAFLSCGVTNTGTLNCWGTRENGSLQGVLSEDPGVQYKAIETSNHGWCGIGSDDQLRCRVTNNSFGLLGDGTLVTKSTIHNPDAGVTYWSVSLYEHRACALTLGNVLKCWGSRGNDGLGFILDGESFTPKVIPSLVDFRIIKTGRSHSCGITTTNDLKCWGENSNGQLGDKTTIHRFTPVNIDPGEKFNHVAVGNEHTCAVTLDDYLKCWGSNSDGQLGNGTYTNLSEPTFIDVGQLYMFVTAGAYHTCGLTDGGEIKCWGKNDNGQLGDQSYTSSTTPVYSDNSDTYQELAAGENHTCGLNYSGIVKCWGDNSAGQLGDGTNDPQWAPNPVSDGTTYRTISTGRAHSCGITTTNVLKCWGANLNGQLGDGTNSTAYTPKVIDVVPYSSISLGYSHSCGVTTSNTLKCWGQNSFGQLGDGTITDRTSPTTIDTNILKVGAGDVHSCSVTLAGGLKCWGENSNAESGFNFGQYFPLPTGDF